MFQTAKTQRNAELGITGDVDFIEMINDWRRSHPLREAPHTADPTQRICVCVRERPLNEKERSRQEHEAMTTANPFVVVHESKV